VSLTLSTAEPAIAGTPPVLPLKTVGWRRVTLPPPPRRRSAAPGGMQFLSAKKKGGSSAAARSESYEEEESYAAHDDGAVLSSADFGFGGSAYGGAPARSAVATAGVIGEYSCVQLRCSRAALWLHSLSALCSCGLAQNSYLAHRLSEAPVR
jgi:hypothetical protein